MDKSKFEIYKSKLTELKKLLDGDFIISSLSAWCENNEIGDKTGLLLNTVVSNDGKLDKPIYNWLSDTSIDDVIDMFMIHDENVDTRPYGGADEKTITSLKKNGITEREYKIFRYLQALKLLVKSNGNIIIDNFFNDNDVHDHARKLILTHYIENTGSTREPTWKWKTIDPTLVMAQNMAKEINNINSKSVIPVIEKPEIMVKPTNKPKTDDDKLIEQYLMFLRELKTMVESGSLKSTVTFGLDRVISMNTMKVISDKCLNRGGDGYSWILVRELNKATVKDILNVAGLIGKTSIPLVSDINIKHFDESIFIESDHSKFRFFDENRMIKANKVKKMMDTIREYGYQNGQLVNVFKCENGYFWIVDGQNRYEACRRLNVPVKCSFFHGDREKAIKMMRILNMGQDNWSITNWINSYAAEGKPAYLKLRELQVKYKEFSQAIILSLCTNHIKTNKNLKNIKTGDLDIYDDHIKRLELAKFINDRIDFKVDRYMAVAIGTFFTKDIPDKHMTKFKENVRIIEKCGDTQQYRLQFQQIMNKNKKTTDHITLIS